MTDLSGPWRGIFNYPSELPATAFHANLRDTGGAISGEIDEPNIFSAGGVAIGALVDGAHTGAAVRFVKYYDDPSSGYDIVHYEGTLAEDGTEISGRWDIPEIWSGTFIMTRDAPPRVAVDTEADIAVE